MSGIGHNQGPDMSPGRGGRLTAWKKSRKALIGRMPIEVIRSRIARARELGLDYKTYASVRAQSGRDVVAFLFSSNALRMHLSAQDLPGSYAQKLRELTGCKTMLAAHRPLNPAQTQATLEAEQNLILLDARKAPLFTDSWSAMRDRLIAFSQDNKMPSDTVVLVGDTGFEREWLAAGRFAGYLPAKRFFHDAEPRP